MTANDIHLMRIVWIHDDDGKRRLGLEPVPLDTYVLTATTIVCFLRTSQTETRTSQKKGN